MKRPNILVLMTDQQHAETVGPGSPCRTPNLDRLVAGGVHFRHAFCPSPICTPARSSFQTGLFPHQHRLVHNAQEGKNYHILGDFPDGTRTLGEALRREGYATAYLGKWDSGLTKDPTAWGYERYVSGKELKSSGGASREEDLSRIVRIEGEPGRRGIIAAETRVPATETNPVRLAHVTARHIHDLATGERPFYIFASCITPHVPWLCPASHARLHDPRKLAEWPSYRDDLRDKPSSYLRHYNKHNYARVPGQWGRIAEAVSLYYGLIAVIDDAVGIIIRALEEAGCIEDTLILFTTDHGELLGAHGLIGKGDCLLDELVRVPFILHWPNGLRAEACDRFANLTDAYATLLAAAGSQQAVPATSRNLLTLSREEPDDCAFFEHHGSQFMNTVRGIRTRQFKYVFRPNEFDELYDLRADPHEMINRIGDPSCRAPLADLRRRLVEWMRATADPAATGADFIFQRETPCAT